MCLSAITWTGFDIFFFLFSHEDSRDEFNIPHDLKILKEVFTLSPGGYHHENAFWKCASVQQLINAGPEQDRAGWKERVAAITKRYAGMSGQYQESKNDNDIPLN